MKKTLTEREKKEESVSVSVESEHLGALLDRMISPIVRERERVRTTHGKEKGV